MGRNALLASYANLLFSGGVRGWVGSFVIVMWGWDGCRTGRVRYHYAGWNWVRCYRRCAYDTRTRGLPTVCLNGWMGGALVCGLWGGEWGAWAAGCCFFFWGGRLA